MMNSGDAAALLKEGAEPPPVLAGVRVLVVDDEPDIRELVSAILTAYRAEVRAVGSVLEALCAIDEGAPDVIVSDIGMPEHDGYELIRAIRAREQRRGVRRIPAVAMTASVGRRARESAIEAGFDVYLGKLFEPFDLVAILHRLIA
jgi:CheY-like chemotaxis protein